MSIFKDTFKPFVVRQIRTREEILSKEDRNLEMHKYVSGKLPWAKMTSFVDYKGTSELSKKYILYGGTLYTKEKDGKLSLNLRSGIGGKGASYGSELGSTQYGIRPMPGIVDISTRCIQAYGSVTEATVKFYAWDVKQLDDLSILFLRPGYRVLLEWGWSMYLDTYSNGDAYDQSSNSNTFKGPFNKFSIENSPAVTIDCFDPTITQDYIYNKLGDLKVKYSANYDGIFGVIRNFNYTLLPNGGFECTVVLLDVAEVIDTIRINNTTGVKIPSALSGSAQDIKSDFELLMDSYCKLETYTDLNGANPTKPSIISGIEEAAFKEDLSYDDIDLFIYRYLSSSTKNTYNTAQANGQNVTISDPNNYKPSFLKDQVLPEGLFDKRNYNYIQLNYFLYILNYIKNVYSLKDKDQTLFSIEICPTDKESKRKTISNGACIASYNSISIDPSCCLIKNSAAVLFKDTLGTKGFLPEVRSTEYSNTELNEYLFPDTNLGKIGNIYLNIGFIIEVFKKQSLENNGYVYLGPYLTEILSKVSFSLGSINDFGLFIKDNKIAIIDKHYTEFPDNAQYYDKFKINISGKASIVRSHKIESKIFPSQASMIAIAAQDRENISSLQTSTYNYLNKDLKDRVIGSLVNSKEDKTLSEKEARKNKLQAILSLIDYVNDYIIPNKILGQYTESTASTMNSYLNTLLVEIEGGSDYKAIVPISVDLNIDGISGLVIGQIYTVNKEVLPKDYEGKHVGFIVTGISNKIDHKEWITSIQSQMCLLDQDAKQKDSLARASELLGDLKALTDRNKYDNINSIRYYNMLAALTLDILTMSLTLVNYKNSPNTVNVKINTEVSKLLSNTSTLEYGAGILLIGDLLKQLEDSAAKIYPPGSPKGYVDKGSSSPSTQRLRLFLKVPVSGEKDFGEDIKALLDTQDVQVVYDLIANTELYSYMVPDVKTIFDLEINKVLSDFKNKNFQKTPEQLAYNYLAQGNVNTAPSVTNFSPNALALKLIGPSIDTNIELLPFRILDPNKVSDATGRLLPLILDYNFAYRGRINLDTLRKNK